MLVRFFDHSTGRGDNAANYLTRNEGRTNSPPEVLEGDLVRTVSLINSINRKHTHTSGVISFAPGDSPSRKELFEVIKDFKAHFFAGLDDDQFDITFVRHSHLDREEIHFLTPRVELTTGKALNIAPPTRTHAFKESFVQAWNLEKGWADPGDPERARELSHQPVKEGHGFKLLGTRQEIHDFLTDQIAFEKVTDRASMIDALQSVGLTINRQGRDYLSIKTEDGTKIRLKGRIYKQDWTFSDEFDRANPREDRARPFRNPEDDAVRAEQTREECLGYREARASYNREQYQRPTASFEHAKVVDMDHDSLLCVDYNDLFDLSLNPELVPRPSDHRPSKRAVGTEHTVQQDQRAEGFRDFGNGSGNVSRAPGTDNTHMQQQSAVPSDREIDSVRPDSARTRALEFAQASARHNRELRQEAEIATRENRSATSVLRGFVSNCVKACRKALESVRHLILPLKKDRDREPPAPGRNGSDFSPGF